jgi:hypothetical protein
MVRPRRAGRLALGPPTAQLRGLGCAVRAVPARRGEQRVRPRRPPRAPALPDRRQCCVVCALPDVPLRPAGVAHREAAGRPAGGGAHGGGLGWGGARCCGRFRVSAGSGVCRRHALAGSHSGLGAAAAQGSGGCRRARRGCVFLLPRRPQPPPPTPSLDRPHPPPTPRQALFRRAQLKALVGLHAEEEGLGGTLSVDEISVICGALDLTHKTAWAAMTPLAKVFMLPVDRPVDEACLQDILSRGHSRVPVYTDGDRWGAARGGRGRPPAQARALRRKRARPPACGAVRWPSRPAAHSAGAGDHPRRVAPPTQAPPISPPPASQVVRRGPPAGQGAGAGGPL